MRMKYLLLCSSALFLAGSAVDGQETSTAKTAPGSDSSSYLSSLGTSPLAVPASAYGGGSGMGTSGALQASNSMNPNFSVVGWFQGEAGHEHPNAGTTADPALQMKETELAFQAIVDPYARGDFFGSIDNTGTFNLEEGYITWFHLPYNLAARAGKFRSYFGAINRTHPHDTPFAIRPLAQQNYFGDGLDGEGGGLSWQVPNPWIYMDLDSEIMRPPAASDAPAFDRAQRNDLLYMERASAYYDLTDEVNVFAGGSYVHSPAGQQFDPVSGSSQTLLSEIYSADITFRWKNPRRAIYHSLLWRTEALWDKRDATTTSQINSRGWYSYVEYQFAQRWKSGVRYDWTEFPTNGSVHDEGGLLWLTYLPSEFSSISLQGSQIKRADGTTEDIGYLRVIFNIGPHGAHPF